MVGFLPKKKKKPLRVRYTRDIHIEKRDGIGFMIERESDMDKITLSLLFLFFVLCVYCWIDKDKIILFQNFLKGWVVCFGKNWFFFKVLLLVIFVIMLVYFVWDFKSITFFFLVFWKEKNARVTIFFKKIINGY